MSIVTDNIDRIIFERKIKRAEFYEAVGVSGTAYNKWKTGGYKPKFGSLQRIADYLQVDLREIITDPEVLKKEKADSENGNDLSEDHKKLIAIIRRLSPASVRFLIEKAQEVEEYQRFLDSQ